MSSFSNGDAYQAKGVGGGAGGFHTTESTRPRSVLASAKVMDSEGKKTLTEWFFKLPDYAKDHIRKLFKPTGDTSTGSATTVVEIGNLKKRSQDKRASVLDPTIATPSKKRLGEGGFEITNDGGIMVAFPAQQQAVEAGKEAGKDVTERTEETEEMGSDVTAESSIGTPSLSQSISSASSTSSSVTSPSPITSSSPPKSRPAHAKQDVARLDSHASPSFSRHSKPRGRVVSTEGKVVQKGQIETRVKSAVPGGVSSKPQKAVVSSLARLRERRFQREQQEREERNAERRRRNLTSDAQWREVVGTWDLGRIPAFADLKFHKINEPSH